MSALRIAALAPSDDAAQIAFLDARGRQSPSVLAYHYPGYRDLLTAVGAGEPAYLGAWDGGELVGILPGFLARSELGTAYCSLPFFGPNAGVLAAPGPVRRELLEAAREMFSRQPGPLTFSVYTPLLDADFAPYDAALAGAEVVERFTSYLPLEGATWKKELRYDLRRAERLGVTVTTEITPARLDELHGLYRQNCLEHDIPEKPRRVIDLLAADPRAGFWFAYHEGKMIAGLIVLWGPTTASYYLPCTLAAARGLAPGSLLVDRAVTEARRRGIQIWNWESSPARESGVHQFKMKWGSSEGAYRVYALAVAGIERLRALGREALGRAFPYFFLYPWDRL